MQALQAVGIDLGTTYSCIAVLNEHGEPISIPNPEGELSTPSVVFFARAAFHRRRASSVIMVASSAGVNP